MDGDPLRDALESAARRLDVDLDAAREQVDVRAGRRHRRQRRFSSATVLVGAIVVIAVVLAVAGKRSDNSSPSITASIGTTVSPTVVYGSVPSRSDAAMAYDAARGQVVLFGGFDGSHERNDTWVWDGSGWSQKHPAAVPPARERAAMAYDPNTKEVVLFGGTVRRSGQTSLALDDTWTWNGTSWSQLHPAHVPPWSSGLAMSYDPRSKSVLLLTLPSSHPNLDLTPDGVSARGDTAFGTWEWNGSDWRELPTPSAPLFAQGAVLHAHPRLTLLPHGAGLLFYSWSIYLGSCPPGVGCGGPPDPTNTLDSQTWTWDGTSWTQQHPTHAPGEAQLVVTPGADAAPTVYPPGELTWQWTGSDWFWVKPNDHAARPDGEGFAVYDDARADVVAYAGRLGSDGAFYDTWTWDGSWTKRTGSTTAVTLPTTAPTTTTLSPLPCASARLHVFLARDLGSTMQQPGAYFGLTNTLSTPCTVDGYPTLTLYDASGRKISADVIHSSSYQIYVDPGAHRVVVERRATVYFGFGWTDANQADGGSQKGCVSIASVRVLVPGTSRSLTAAAPLSSVFCPPGGAVTAIAPRAAFAKGAIP